MKIEFGIATGLLALLIVGFEFGFRYGRRSSGKTEGASQIGAIQGAVLGLLALMLGFSFAGAAGRFIERQGLIVREANAIGTAYLRADLLNEPNRSQLRKALADYLAKRLDFSAKLRYGMPPDLAAIVQKHHDEIWRAARDGVKARPTAMMGVLPPVNEVIDLHATRAAASRIHLPTLVMALLILCSFLSMVVIGYGCSASGRRFPVLTATLAILVAAALWTTIDLDYGRIGLIQQSDAPLQALRLSE